MKNFFLKQLKLFTLKTFIFISIFAIAFFCRFYELGNVPPGLTNDEADIGYDAYSILITGRDQWGEYLPLTAFRDFGDYRLPLYTYLVIPIVYLFDLSAFSVRFPSAIFGSISVILIYFVAKKLFEKSEVSHVAIAFVAMVFMAFSSWAIGLSRIGIESNIAISFFSCFNPFLSSCVQKNHFFFIVSFVFFSLTIYTYTSYVFFTPISIIILLFFFRNQVAKNKKYILVSLFIFFIIIIPLFYSQSAIGVRTSQITFINSQDSIGLFADLNDRRGSCQEVFPQIICKIIENKQIVVVSTFLRNYIHHFSFDFLYLSGTTTQYSILPQRSLFYTFEIFSC